MNEIKKGINDFKDKWMEIFYLNVREKWLDKMEANACVRRIATIKTYNSVTGKRNGRLTLLKGGETPQI